MGFCRNISKSRDDTVCFGFDFGVGPKNKDAIIVIAMRTQQLGGNLDLVTDLIRCRNSICGMPKLMLYLFLKRSAHI